MAIKWNVKKHRYDHYKLPEGSVLVEYNQFELCSCAQCGRKLPYCGMYPSIEIQNYNGCGYGVCEKCHKEEAKRANPHIEDIVKEIDEYYAEAFPEDWTDKKLTDSAFKDIYRVPLAYTETEDGDMIEVTADLIEYRINMYGAQELVSRIEFESPKDMLFRINDYLDFDFLVAEAETKFNEVK